MSMKSVLIAIDQLVNTCVRLSDGWGMPDETISARAWRLRDKHPWLVKLIDRVMFWEPNHCQACYGMEMLRGHLPEEYRRVLAS